MDRSLLANATSADDSPTPGYMLSEIAKSTLGNYQANVQIQEYLLSRIKKDNHNVKYKCLVIIKGRPEFKKEIGRSGTVEPIKDCLQYKGPPDPLRGDEIYKRVHQAARDALEAIYDGQAPQATSAVKQANRIQGLGNNWTPPEDLQKQGKQGEGYISSLVNSVTTAVYGDGTEAQYAGHPGASGAFGAPGAYGGTGSGGYGGSGGSGYGGSGGGYAGSGGSGASWNSNEYSGGGGGGYSSSGMSGIGNPNFKDPREEKSWTQRATELARAASQTGMQAATSIASRVAGSTGAGSDSSYNYTTNRGPNAFGSNDPAYSPQQSGNAFGGAASRWNQGNNASVPPFGGVSNNMSTTTSIVPDFPSGPPGVGRAGSAATDGKYERSLIEALCEPGGLKTVPPEDKLQPFLITAATLSPDIVGSCLLEILNSDQWQSRVKALIVIAGLLSSKDYTIYYDWWLDHTDELASLQNDPKQAVRLQAQKTLRIMNKDLDTPLEPSPLPRTASGSAKNPAAPMAVPAASAAGEFSLLDSYDAVSPAAPAPAPLFGAPAPVPDEDLFSGMSLGSSSSNPVPPVPAAAPAAAAPVPPKNAISDSFDFLNGDEMAPAPLSPPPSVPAAAAPAVGGDIFGGMAVNGAPAPSSGGKPNYATDLADLLSGPSMPSNGMMQPVMMGMPMVAPPAAGGAYNNMAYNTRPQQQPMPGSFNSNPQMNSNRGVGGPPMPGNMPPPPPPNAYGMRSSVIAPGMLSPTASRKTIPTAEAAGNSGFAFMGGSGPAPGQRPGGNDSFSFVTDAMKNYK